MYESEDKMVSHPNHYQGANGMEVIDVIENFTCDLVGNEATNTGQIIKYILRWKKKNGLQDLEKTMWYLQRLINIVRDKKMSEQAAEEIIDGEKLNNMTSPGLRCKGCIYDGEFCSSPSICTCDSTGKYTGYTCHKPTSELKWNYSRLPILPGMSIKIGSLERVKYLMDHISKTIDTQECISMAAIEAILGEYDIFRGDMLYKTRHGWTKDIVDHIIPIGWTIYFPVEVLIDESKGNNVAHLQPVTISAGIYTDDDKSFISIIDLSTHKVIEVYESDRMPFIMDNRHDYFVVGYIRKKKTATKKYDKKKVTYSLTEKKGE